MRVAFVEALTFCQIWLRRLTFGRRKGSIPMPRTFHPTGRAYSLSRQSWRQAGGSQVFLKLAVVEVNLKTVLLCLLDCSVYSWNYIAVRLTNSTTQYVQFEVQLTQLSIRGPHNAFPLSTFLSSLQQLRAPCHEALWWMAKPFTWDFEPRNVTFKLRVFGRPGSGGIDFNLERLDCGRSCIMMSGERFQFFAILESCKIH